MILWHHLIQLHVLVYLLHREIEFPWKFGYFFSLFYPEPTNVYRYRVPNWFTLKDMEGIGTFTNEQSKKQCCVVDP
jgi:hypothetical protein